MTFWRIHDTGHEFSADNAWSSQMDMDRRDGEDGTPQQECWCQAMDGEPAGDCRDCDGEGWVDCQRGYSCCPSAQALAAYFAGQGISLAGWHGFEVIEFEGRAVGTGPDGEPLAVPEGVARRMTVAEFAGQYA